MANGNSGGIAIAFAANAFDNNPTWYRLDDPTKPALRGNNVQSWSTDRGRQFELDKTQAGTATLTLMDTDGRFDPTNTSGPYYGNIGPMRQAQIMVLDPINGGYHDIFTGYVESWQYGITKDEHLMTVTASLVDGFEALARAEVVPDATGVATYNAQSVDDRINALLSDGQWPAIATDSDGNHIWRNIFSGNVYMQTTEYNPQTSILSAIQDAADAEFPNVANVFMDKHGAVAFRGRWTRFTPQNYSADPPTPSKPLRTWVVGDRFTADTLGCVPINDIEWNLDLKNLIDAALVTPYGLPQNLIAGMLEPPTLSSSDITKYGVRFFSIPDILVQGSITNGDNLWGGGSDAQDAIGECKLFGLYYVNNYNTPVKMISKIDFVNPALTDPLAAPAWKFFTGVEIGDVVTVTTHNPGGGGFSSSQYFVEGIHNQVTLPDDGNPLWMMSLDLSPRVWYKTFPYVSSGTTHYPTYYSGT